jgi:hypothetical protein
MPFAVLEALACGAVVLVSEPPAHREIGLAAEQYFPVGGIDRASASVFETVWRHPSGPDRAAESLERR